MAWLGEHRDGTLFELRDTLSAQGVVISKSALHRFLVRHDQTRKKTGHAVEQSRPDLLEMRPSWFDKQLDLDPARLVFIDETWTATNMARTHGRCLKVSGCEWVSHTAIARQRRLLPDCKTL